MERESPSLDQEANQGRRMLLRAGGLGALALILGVRRTLGVITGSAGCTDGKAPHPLQQTPDSGQMAADLGVPDASPEDIARDDQAPGTDSGDDAAPQEDGPPKEDGSPPEDGPAADGADAFDGSRPVDSAGPDGSGQDAPFDGPEGGSPDGEGVDGPSADLATPPDLCVQQSPQCTTMAVQCGNPMCPNGLGTKIEECRPVGCDGTLGPAVRTCKC